MYYKRLTYKNYTGVPCEKGKSQIATTFSHSYLEKQTAEIALLSRER